MALGIGLFAGSAVLSALCREFPLGTGCVESKGACAKSISLSTKAANPIVVDAMSVIFNLDDDNFDLLDNTLLQHAKTAVADLDHTPLTGRFDAYSISREGSSEYERYPLKKPNAHDTYD
jgi:hypothetical protein